MVTDFNARIIENFKEVEKGDDLAELIIGSLDKGLENGDVVVLASKIVSRSQGKIVNLDSVKVTPRAIELSAKTGKLPEACQVVINESREVFLSPNGALIGIHKLGYRLTSAGVDKFTKDSVTLIPDDPDGTAGKIREYLEKMTGKKLSVLIVDSDGRDDRRGSIGVALGVSGFHPILKTKQIDVVTGKEKFSEEDISAMLANAASLLLGQRGKGTPVVIISGFSFDRDLESGIIKNVLH
jgi:coenzyme F420-0:L-glutamate ligase/coenzyme F420-1:gamma-L-glutamate ligase